ncbi:MAG: biotin/lipoyl-binding protein, partial [Burkholderiaceae bacterium]
MTQHNLFASRVLTDMQDGVMVIDRTGRLITINEAAQRILGMSAFAGEDTTFAERFLLLEHNDEFNQAILDAIYQQTVAQQKIVPFTHEGRTVVLTLTTSFLHEEVDGVRQSAGVIVVFNDITAMRELQDAQARSADELKARHRELQDAYRNIEDSNAKLAEAIGKMQAVRRVAAAFATLLIIGLAAGYWSWGGWREAAGGTPPAESPPPGAAQHTVTPRELTLNLSLTGRLSPLKTVNVSSPLNGRLASIHVRHGDTVKTGDILAVMDTTELEVKLREARSAVMRAEEGLNQLMRWDQSADVTRARRSVIRSKLALDAQKKALDEAERLFSKGIIPANELDAAKQQYITQQLDHQTAEDELASAQARGSSDQQQIARMELDNHRTRLSQYQTEL